MDGSRQVDSLAATAGRFLALIMLGLGQFSTAASAADAAARDVIVRHIDDLIPALAERPRPQETLRGVVTGVDERNDLITLRLASDVSADFRVQDGLLFNAVRDGDQVEITVENIEGAKTIVGLKIE
jgi:Cu/Ag efflux protein CusF